MVTKKNRCVCKSTKRVKYGSRKGIEVNDLEHLTEHDLDAILNEPELPFNERKRRLEAQKKKHSTIEINYVENGILETTHRPLFSGQLDLMGHRLDVTESTTNSDLSKFLGVKVIAYRLYNSYPEKGNNGKV